MRGLVLFSLLFLFLGVLVSAKDIKQSMMDSVVFVQTWDSFGCGVIIGTNYVLTVSHLDRDFIADGLPATILKADARYDLIHLKTKGNYDKDQVIRWATTFSVFDSVYIVGFLNGEKLPAKGMISKIKEDYVLIDAKVVEGFSGGGVFNEQGELIGLVRGGVGKPDKFLMAWSVPRLWKFLGLTLKEVIKNEPK